MKFRLILLSCLSVISGLSQSTIQRCLEAGKFDLTSFHASDFSTTDTLKIDELNYLAVRSSLVDPIQLLCEARAFKNSDGTYLLLISGLYADEQCSSHKTHWFRFDLEKNSIEKVNASKLFPEINYADLIDTTKVFQVFNNYLPAIKAEYLGENATLNTLLEEFYSFHFSLSNPKFIECKLDICDYIPTNVVGFSDDDWNIITQHKTIRLQFNSKTGSFKIKK